MKIQKPRAELFAEALGEEVSSAFNKLASEIMKQSALSKRDKALIAVGCAAAIRCEHCINVNRERASMAGASMEEILEASAIGGLVRLASGFNAASVLLDNQEI
jgi:AhpD family alkylhydroperoxidase